MLRLMIACGAVLVAEGWVRGASAEGAATRPASAAAPPAEPGRPGLAAPQPLDDLLEPIRARNKVPALGAAVVSGGSVTALGAVGVRKAGHEARVTTADLWHLGSDTKAFTATLAAIMVERGELRWDTTLAEAFPQLRDQMHEGFRGATLAQLCTNRAGAPGDLSAGGLWGRLWTATGTPTQQRRVLLEGVVRRAPTNPPGTQFEYSNAGFAIAGHLCETVAGKPYEELMAERLFKPLGMTSCGWGAPGSPGGGGPDQPRGHDKSGKPQEPDPTRRSGVAADNPIAVSPAGRLHCTLDDWARFVTLHLRGHASNPQRRCELLKAETFDRLHAPPDKLNAYAFGWFRDTRPWAGPEGDRLVLTHSGSNTLWFSVVWVAPAKDFAVLVCCNQGERGEKAADEAAWAIIQRHAK